MRIQIIKTIVKALLPRPLLRMCQYWSIKDITSIKEFMFEQNLRLMIYQKLFIIMKLYEISFTVECPHTQEEILSFIRAILSIPRETEGCIVEAGSYKGGSTAKFSIADKIANRQLKVFDSFEGIPWNDEQPKFIWGGNATFHEGSWCGKIEEVRRNIRRFGRLEVSQLIKGWFEDTMPKFSEPIVAIYLDVDLASSTRTCLKYLYPLLVPGGVLYSQDGHLLDVVNVFDDDKFWNNEVGYPKPYIEGLGKKKLIKIVKPISFETN